MRSETCGRCGEEVRFGRRGTGGRMWLHKNATDHVAILGRLATAEDLAEIERQMDLPRERRVKQDPEGFPLLFEIETYTTREHDLERYRKSAKFRLAEEQDSDEEVEVFELPAPEVARHDVTAEDFPPRSGIRQIINLVGKQGWELRRLTAARGPWVGSKGEVLSISDSVVLAARGPDRLDGTTPVAVASWRDGKFFSAYIGTLKDRQLTTRSVNATDLKDWMKIS